LLSGRAGILRELYLPVSWVISMPDRMTKKQLIRLVMQRWRTERVYEDLKVAPLPHLPPQMPGFVSRAPGLFRLPVGPLTQ
jgi:hypothetical protein